MEETMTEITIRQAAEAADLAAVRALMRRYVGWHYHRHAEHRAMIDRYFDPAAFEAELAALPGRYAPPAGRLLLARVGAEPAGCVALRDLEGGACEMKRMFVAPEHQGRHLGLALGERFLYEAGAAGYRVARLDTGPLQYEAHRLYARLGFRLIAPYYPLDPEMAGFLLFMERPLSPSVRTGSTTDSEPPIAPARSVRRESRLPCHQGGDDRAVTASEHRDVLG